MSNEKPYYRLSRQGEHVFLEIGPEVLELTASEAQELAFDLHNFAYDMDFSEEE